ncbi:MAG: 23S rRNA (pseudouridine(1915)-N(3))-methyltransferase RlmH [Candidatus Saccharimonadales bacterium]
MPIRIISIGKKPSAWLKQGLEGYQKRLKRPFNVKWSILPNSPSKGLKSRQDEAKSIIGLLSSDDYVILLDESGKNIDSVALSRLMENQLNKSKNIAFIIGGSYGVDESVFRRADYIWSLSKLVFPHQIVRLLLIEQIYRAQEISNNRPYHHE